MGQVDSVEEELGVLFVIIIFWLMYSVFLVEALKELGQIKVIWG